MASNGNRKLNYIFVDLNTQTDLQELLKKVVVEKLSLFSPLEHVEINFFG